MLVVRPHRPHARLNAALSYTCPRSVVSVRMYVCVLGTQVSCAKRLNRLRCHSDSRLVRVQGTWEILIFSPWPFHRDFAWYDVYYWYITIRVSEKVDAVLFQSINQSIYCYMAARRLDNTVRQIIKKHHSHCKLFKE